MTLLAPDPAPDTPRSRPEPAQPAIPVATREPWAAQTMIELHFAARDRIADFLNSPRADTLSDLHAAVQQFLETERHLFLLDPTHVDEAGIDLRALLRGRRAVRHALNRVVWSESGTFAMARATEALRLAFIEHATLYSHHTTSHRPPIALPAGTSH